MRLPKLDYYLELYKKWGWVLHPLSAWDDKGKSPGKRPLTREWQKLAETPADLAGHDGNIGAIGGKASGMTPVDYDHDLFIDIFKERGKTLECKRANAPERGKLFLTGMLEFGHEKYLDIGIEILNDANAVIPPSIHHTGEPIYWIDENAPVMEISEESLASLKTLLKARNNLHAGIAKCRRCFRNFWNKGQMPQISGSEGRDMMAAFAAELKLQGCGLDEVSILYRLAHRKNYDPARCKDDFERYAKFTWKCETLREKCPTFISCEDCPILKKKEKKEIEEKRRESPFALSEDGCLMELFLHDGKIMFGGIGKDGKPFYRESGLDSKLGKVFPIGTVDPAYRELIMPEDLLPAGILGEEKTAFGKIILPSEIEFYESEKNLFEETASLIHDFYQTPDELSEVIIVTFIISSFAYEKLRMCPPLFLRGLTATGKSLLLEMLAHFTFRPYYTMGSTSPSALRRIAQHLKGTLLVDEAHYGVEKEDEITKDMHARCQGGTVTLSDPDDPKKIITYRNFGLTVIGQRRPFRDDTIGSKGITIKTIALSRKDIRCWEDYSDEFYKRAEGIRNRLIAWRLLNIGKIRKVPIWEKYTGRDPRVRQASSLIKLLLGTGFAEIAERHMDKIADKMEQEAIEGRADSLEGMITANIVDLWDRGIEAIPIGPLAGAMGMKAQEMGKTLSPFQFKRRKLPSKNIPGLTDPFKLTEGQRAMHIVPTAEQIEGLRAK